MAGIRYARASVLLVLHTMTQVKTVTAIVTAPTVQTMILENSRRGLLCLFKVFDPVVRDLDPLFDKGGLFFQLEGPFDHRIMLVDLLFQLIQAIGNQGGTFPVRQLGTGQRADHRKNGDDDPFGHAVTSVQP